jgi:hypothetical protein
VGSVGQSVFLDTSKFDALPRHKNASVSVSFVMENMSHMLVPPFCRRHLQNTIFSISVAQMRAERNCVH